MEGYEQALTQWLPRRGERQFYAAFMPVPPILDVYVVWHPDDRDGARVFERLHSHFHSPTYSGLIGGAVEVYARSVGWHDTDDAPRPLVLPGDMAAPVQPALFAAIIPVLGAELRQAVQNEPRWRSYMDGVGSAANSRVVVAPVSRKDVNLARSALLCAIGTHQRLPDESLDDDQPGLLERSAAQTIAQLATGSKTPIKVFVSHAKHWSVGEDALAQAPLFEEVRGVIANTKLAEFFDARDLQPGSDWAAELEENAAKSALLMVRTDVYASREWTQREVLAAKRHDVPVVALVALTDGEARGSFLMDHVPTVPLDPPDHVKSINASLNRLVDEALKRALWSAQSEFMLGQGFDWAPVHAPEPVTAIKWLAGHRAMQADDRHLWIIHPDPPLGSAERRVTDELCALAGFGAKVDILTPRTFAARGGELPRDA